jgi:hypothetical protein
MPQHHCSTEYLALDRPDETRRTCRNEQRIQELIAAYGNEYKEIASFHPPATTITRRGQGERAYPREGGSGRTDSFGRAEHTERCGERSEPCGSGAEVERRTWRSAGSGFPVPEAAAIEEEIGGGDGSARLRSVVTSTGKGKQVVRPGQPNPTL